MLVVMRYPDESDKLCSRRETRRAFRTAGSGKQGLYQESLQLRMCLLEPQLSQKQSEVVKRERKMPEQLLVQLE